MYIGSASGGLILVSDMSHTMFIAVLKTGSVSRLLSVLLLLQPLPSGKQGHCHAMPKWHLSAIDGHLASDAARLSHCRATEWGSPACVSE